MATCRTNRVPAFTSARSRLGIVLHLLPKSIDKKRRLPWAAWTYHGRFLCRSITRNRETTGTDALCLQPFREPGPDAVPAAFRGRRRTAGNPCPDHSCHRSRACRHRRQRQSRASRDGAQRGAVRGPAGPRADRGPLRAIDPRGRRNHRFRPWRASHDRRRDRRTPARAHGLRALPRAAGL